MRRLIDYVVIFLIVLAALQLSAWYETQQERRTARELGAQLAAELKKEAWIAAYTVSYSRDVLNNAKKVVDALNRDGLVDEEALIAAFRASQYTWWNQRRSAFDALSGSGLTQHLENPELWTTASLVYNSPLLRDMAAKGSDSQYRIEFRRRLSLEVQQQLADSCGDASVAMGDFDSLEDVLNYTCTPTIAPKALEGALTSLRDGNLLPALRLRIATLETQLADLTEYQAVLQDFR